MPEFPPEILAGLRWVAAGVWLGLAVLLLAYLRHERRKRSATERELRDGESRYRAIFETAVDAIIVADRTARSENLTRRPKE